MAPKQNKKAQEEEEDAVYEVEQIVDHRRSAKNQVNFTSVVRVGYHAKERF